MAMGTNSTAALGLKRLREHAGLSVRELAAALRDLGSKYGRSPSSYAYYENEFSKTYLPVDLVDALTPILRNRGTPPIAERDVLALGGADRNSLWKIKPEFTETPGPISKIEVETNILAAVIRGVDDEAEALALNLSPEKKSELVTEICRRIAATDVARQPWLIGWEIAHACRFAKALLQ